MIINESDGKCVQLYLVDMFHGISRLPRLIIICGVVDVSYVLVV